jgi:transcriptional regulator with XRE-family HTH domain
MSAEQFASYLRQRMNEKRLTISETAKRAQISRGALNKYLSLEVRDGKLSTFVQLARVLDEHPLKLLSIFFNGWDFAEQNANRTESIAVGDDVGFISDLDLPDNYPVARSATFEKSWELKNVGKVPWLNRRMICIDEEVQVSSQKEALHDHRFTGLQPLTPEIEVPTTMPSENVILTVKFKAPSYPGTMISHWKMIDEDGNYCYPNTLGIFCKVQVLAF